jgi:hypothetical protein
VAPLGPPLQPRTGCTCYQPAHSQTIFIFGGFYEGTRNHLDFQTDITLLKIEPRQLLLENIPQSFFLQASIDPRFPEPMVTALHNDLIRPRREYQIYQKSKDENSSEIILFGGVGQKFIRPYTLLHHTGHLIHFQGDSLTSIKKIKLNNLVPASLSRPIRMKS